jgi:hypothetical protein
MSDRPYAIIAAMPGHKPKAIGRCNNRIDADSIVRFLQRKCPTVCFTSSLIQTKPALWVSQKLMGAGRAIGSSHLQQERTDLFLYQPH